MPDPEKIPDEEKPTERFFTTSESDPSRFQEERKKIATLIALKRSTYIALCSFAITKPGPINEFLQELIAAGIYLLANPYNVKKLEAILKEKGTMTPFYPGTKTELLKKIKNGEIAARIQRPNCIVDNQVNAIIFIQDGTFVLAEVFTGTKSMKLVLDQKDYSTIKGL